MAAVDAEIVGSSQNFEDGRPGSSSVEAGAPSSEDPGDTEEGRGLLGGRAEPAVNGSHAPKYDLDAGESSADKPSCCLRCLRWFLILTFPVITFVLGRYSIAAAGAAASSPAATVEPRPSPAQGKATGKTSPSGAQKAGIRPGIGMHIPGFGDVSHLPSGFDLSKLPHKDQGLRSRLEKGLEEVKRMRKGLLDYYEGDSLLLDLSPQRKPEDDVILIGKIAKAVLGKQTPGDGHSFSIGFVGSSVTAAHDAFGTASYPSLLNRTLRPVWEKLGVHFMVYNAAVGGRGPNPWSAFCLENMVGTSVDVVVREFEYWSLDDTFSRRPSLDVKKEGKDSSAAAIEIFVRGALRLPRQPAVHFVKLSHGQPGNGLSYLSYFTQQGRLAPYSEFSINGFDGFGEPFNHFPERQQKRAQRPNWNEGPSPRKVPCSGPDVSTCPLSWDKQDGHHSRPKYFGYDEEKHPEWEKYRKKFSQENLFVNWHMGALGHEVIAHQMAYYYLKVMEIALTRLLSGPQVDDTSPAAQQLIAAAAAKPLPQNAQCSDLVCSPQFAPVCTYSAQPRYGGLEVKDLVIPNDGVASTWKRTLLANHNQPGCSERETSCPSESCFNRARSCSYLDTKFGMHGGQADGAITLGFNNMYSCVIWIGEGTYEWFKPSHLANWNTDVVFFVDGKECKEPQCHITSVGSHTQVAVVQARQLMGGSCRRKTVKVALEVRPGSPTAHSCRPEGSRCRLGKDAADEQNWPGYDSNKLCKREGEACVSVPRFADPSQIKTFIEFTVAF